MIVREKGFPDWRECAVWSVAAWRSAQFWQPSLWCWSKFSEATAHPATVGHLGLIFGCCNFAQFCLGYVLSFPSCHDTWRHGACPWEGAAAAGGVLKLLQCRIPCILSSCVVRSFAHFRETADSWAFETFRVDKSEPSLCARLRDPLVFGARESLDR